MKRKKRFKVISLLLAVMMILSSLPFAGISALAATSGDFRYEILNDGTAEITDYTGSAETLEIPATLDGYTVTSIGEWAFEGCGSLTSITIPNSVTSISSFAFSYCANIKNVNISKSVIKIGASPFSGCDNLEKITVDSENNYFCSVDDILFNKSKTELIQYTPANKRENYSIPYGVKKICFRAFGGNSDHNTDEGVCRYLTSIDIPESVEYIDEYAFHGLNYVKEIKVPKSVKIICPAAFYRDYDNQDLFTDIYIYNKDCIIENEPEIGQTIPLCTTIHGYKNSTAEEYANEYSLNFIQINDTEVISGDVNGDGKINALDVLIVKRYIAKYDDAKLEGDKFALADVSGDGKVNAKDALAIMQKIAKLIDSFDEIK